MGVELPRWKVLVKTGWFRTWEAEVLGYPMVIGEVLGFLLTPEEPKQVAEMLRQQSGRFALKQVLGYWRVS